MLGAYQEQITGHSDDEAYWVGGVGKNSGGVKFDGFKDGVLLEAKGPGYAKFFEGLDPKEWFENSGAQGLIEQAQRQTQQGSWYGHPHRVACRGEARRRGHWKLLESEDQGINVVHTPAL